MSYKTFSLQSGATASGADIADLSRSLFLVVLCPHNKNLKLCAPASSPDLFPMQFEDRRVQRGAFRERFSLQLAAEEI